MHDCALGREGGPSAPRVEHSYYYGYYQGTATERPLHGRAPSAAARGAPTLLNF